MKHYIFNGKTYDTLPDPLHTEAGGESDEHKGEKR